MRGENEFDPDIPNEDLTVEDILGVGPSYWQGIDLFALTFGGHEHFGSGQCAVIANSTCDRYQVDGSLPGTLTELRTCLFYEQRRWRQYDQHADAGNLEYILALLDGIRTKVSKGELA
jgi:hypothetical protein